MRDLCLCTLDKNYKLVQCARNMYRNGIIVNYLPVGDNVSVGLECAGSEYRMNYLLRGILIGFVFGVPAGAIGALTMQRTFSYGRKAGLLTGLGSSFADSFYAAVGVFGITLISDFIAAHQTVINLLGGSLILSMGIRLLAGKGEAETKKAEYAQPAKMILSTFAMGITNPATMFIFLFAFSFFGVAGEAAGWQRAFVVFGVFAGTYIWWGAIAGIVPVIRERAVRFRERRMNKIFGTLLCLLAAAVFLRIFLS